jgi:hypothetical protein
VLQGLFDDALKWLSRAEKIATTAGEAKVVQEARVYLRQLQELAATSPESSGKN